MVAYLKTDHILEEFSCVGAQRHPLVEHFYHSMNTLNVLRLDAEQRAASVKKIIFADAEEFHTSLYDRKHRLVFLSSLRESHLGVYRNKKTGFRVAVPEAAHPLTDPAMWEGYVKGPYLTSGHVFTTECPESFSREYEFVGRITPEESLAHFKEIFGHLRKDAVFVSHPWE